MKYLFSFLAISFLLTFAIFNISAQEVQQSTTAPETLEEARTLGERILRGLPEAMKKPWHEALVFWRRMLDWFKNIWYAINSFLGREVEKRKPEVKEELEKEKQEIKEEIPRAGKSLWQRFKELIK